MKNNKSFLPFFILSLIIFSIFGCGGSSGGNGEGNNPPTVTLAADPTSGEAPLNITFSALANDQDGFIVSFEWDFDGDGIYDLNSGTNYKISHIYTVANYYEVSVRVTDNQGAIADQKVKISVSSDARPDQLAFLHIQEVMDKFHKTFDVYTDLSAAGNHFLMLGSMASDGDIDKIVFNLNFTDNCFSGTSCIETKFDSNGNNWGGLYFMNGVLNGEETEAKLNWGDYPNSGFDLTGATKLSFWAKGSIGGERVEFFTLGMGRNDDTGIPTHPYPDSSEKVSLGVVELKNEWVQYTIDLRGKSLSYVIGGFGWVTNALENENKDITFYLDDIKFDLDRLNEPRFLNSYETIKSSLDFDTVMKNSAFTYDNALVLISYVSRGTDEDLQRARLLADAFVYSIYHDRYFTDGRLRNAYQGGDLLSFPGWEPNNLKNTTRLPGWWDETNFKWYEDKFAVSTYTGPMAWTIISLLTFYEHEGGNDYLQAAITLAEWIEYHTKDYRGSGGYTGGYEGWELEYNNQEGPTKLLWKSTEHNIDVYVAFSRLYAVTENIIWKERALSAKGFIESMWNESEGYFWTGTLEDGATINKYTLSSDVNAWALMALGDISRYEKAINWVENNCYIEEAGFKGFDFNDDRDHIWLEGTAHMILAFDLIGEKTKYNTFLSELERAQIIGPNNNGKGITASIYDGLTTGFDWVYFNRLHIGATAWFIFAENQYNPFWGISTSDPIPSL